MEKRSLCLSTLVESLHKILDIGIRPVVCKKTVELEDRILEIFSVTLFQQK